MAPEPKEVMEEELEEETEPAKLQNKTGAPPVFAEKPKVVPLDEEGSAFHLIVRYRSETKCKTRWYYKNTALRETSYIKICQEKNVSYNETRVEITVRRKENTCSIFFFLFSSEPSSFTACPSACRPITYHHYNTLLRGSDVLRLP